MVQYGISEKEVEDMLGVYPVEKLVKLRERWRSKGMPTKTLTGIVGKRIEELRKQRVVEHDF